MLYSGWLNHCTPSAISSAQWLGVVYQTAMLPRFSQAVKEHLQTCKQLKKIPEKKTRKRAFTVSWIKKKTSRCTLLQMTNWQSI